MQTCSTSINPFCFPLVEYLTSCTSGQASFQKYKRFTKTINYKNTCGSLAEKWCEHQVFNLSMPVRDHLARYPKGKQLSVENASGPDRGCPENYSHHELRWTSSLVALHHRHAYGDVGQSLFLLPVDGFTAGAFFF
jgi:hypothetical protein